MREIIVGDRVKFLNDVGEGVVLEINGALAVVEDEDGFDREYQLKDLISVGDRRKRLKCMETNCQI